MSIGDVERERRVSAVKPISSPGEQKATYNVPSYAIATRIFHPAANIINGNNKQRNGGQNKQSSIFNPLEDTFVQQRKFD